MAVWHEIQCDVLTKECQSHSGESPCGWSMRAARNQAKKMGFTRVAGKDVCQKCADLSSDKGEER